MIALKVQLIFNLKLYTIMLDKYFLKITNYTQK